PSSSCFLPPPRGAPALPVAHPPPPRKAPDPAAPRPAPRPRRNAIRSPNGPVSAGGASAAFLLLLLEGGAFARGLPAILLAHGHSPIGWKSWGSARRRPSIIDRPCNGAQPPD